MNMSDHEQVASELERRLNALALEVFQRCVEAEFGERIRPDWSVSWAKLTKVAADEIAGLLRSPELQTAQSGEMVLRVIQKHRRHVELSPGAGAECQQYGIAVCDDIEADIRALTHDSAVPQQEKALRLEWKEAADEEFASMTEHQLAAAASEEADKVFADVAGPGACTLVALLNACAARLRAVPEVPSDPQRLDWIEANEPVVSKGVGWDATRRYEFWVVERGGSTASANSSTRHRWLHEDHTL